MSNFIDKQVPRLKDLKAIYWYLYQTQWIPTQEIIKKIVLQIPTTFVGYDYTFDMGSNIYDIVGGQRDQIYPEIFNTLQEEVEEKKQSNLIEDIKDNNEEIKIQNEENIQNNIDSDDSEFDFEYLGTRAYLQSENINVISKNKAGKLQISYLMTGNSKEFIYDIIPVPGMYYMQQINEVYYCFYYFSLRKR